MITKIDLTALMITILAYVVIILNPDESRIWVMGSFIGTFAISLLVFIVTTLLRIWL